MGHIHGLGEDWFPWYFTGPYPFWAQLVYNQNNSATCSDYYIADPDLMTPTGNVNSFYLSCDEKRTAHDRGIISSPYFIDPFAIEWDNCYNAYYYRWSSQPVNIFEVCYDSSWQPYFCWTLNTCP